MNITVSNTGNKDTQYIIVDTRNGYMVRGDDNERSIAFTKDIAHATVFNNFDVVKTLCDRQIASAWEKVDGKFTMCYTAPNTYNGGSINDQM